MSELRSKHPYEFFTRGNTIRANLQQVKRRRWDYEPPYTADSFVLPGAVQDWLDTEFEEEVIGNPPNPLDKSVALTLILNHLGAN